MLKAMIPFIKHYYSIKSLTEHMDFEEDPATPTLNNHNNFA